MNQPKLHPVHHSITLWDSSLNDRHEVMRIEIDERRSPIRSGGEKLRDLHTLLVKMNALCAFPEQKLGADMAHSISVEFDGLCAGLVYLTDFNEKID